MNEPALLPDPDPATSLAVPAAAWIERALCTGLTDLFFASPGERPGTRARREARASQYCQRCPVRLQCRDHARTHRESGFWGGESEEDRARAGFPPRSSTLRSVIDASHAS
jgi:WhiB family redox-sensing transcriptional regulator